MTNASSKASASATTPPPAKRFSYWRVAKALFRVYLGVLVLGWFLSDYLIFVPPPPSYHEGGPYYRVAVTARERIGLLALTNAAAPYVILYAHGNGEDIGPDLRDYLSAFRDHGFAVYAFDYRGYGISDGQPNTCRAREDAEAAYQHLVRDRGIAPERIILYGQSLGAALALDLAARHNNVAGLVVESGFVTAFRVRTVYPLFPLDKFRNNRRMREVHCPVMVMHGEIDNVIPIWHGRELYRLAPEPKLAYWPECAEHGNVRDTDERKYWQHMDEFMALVQRVQTSKSGK